MRFASSAPRTRLPVFLACAFLGGAAAFVPGRPLVYPAAHGRAGAAACALVRPLPRVVAPLCLAEDDEEAATEEELKDELFELLDEVQDRGLDASEDDVADILEIIAELEETEGGDTCFDFANSPLFAGTFRLLYTSSKTFHTNQGLMAYSRDFQGVETPELLMKLQNSIGSRLVFFEEPLELQGNTLVGVLGGLTKTDVLRAECSWRATSSGVFASAATPARLPQTHNGPRSIAPTGGLFARPAFGSRGAAHHGGRALMGARRQAGQGHPGRLRLPPGVPGRRAAGAARANPGGGLRV